jgi:hypothetical protein
MIHHKISALPAELKERTVGKAFVQSLSVDRFRCPTIIRDLVPKLLPLVGLNGLTIKIKAGKIIAQLSSYECSMLRLQALLTSEFGSEFERFGDHLIISVKTLRHDIHLKIKIWYGGGYLNNKEKYLVYCKSNIYGVKCEKYVTR